MPTRGHTYPSDNELRKLLRFDPHSGAIWLGERRMLLLHTTAMSELRRDLIASVGTEHARRLLTRMGYASGSHDASFAVKTRGHCSPDDMFMVGPQLHMLEGAARVTPLSMSMDIATGHFLAEFRWDDSWEAHAHRLTYGVVDEPACWILLGYASGYTSAFMGKLILFKETLCGACGHDHCHVVGKPIEEWPDGESFRSYFEAHSLLEKIDALTQQVEVLKTSLEPQNSGGMLVGDSPAFQHAHDLMMRAAQTQVTVLLDGETGVGKERFARAVHHHSERTEGPFVAVNCAALPAELIEAELFGVEKGAYTGAHAARAGRFERAEGGTLFLDEVGDMPLSAQAKLLRVLQEGEIERLGGESTRKVDVRLVAATNVDLEAAVAKGRFRRDLWYRLNVYPIRIPPLRERIADIEPLARHLLTRFMTTHNKRLKGFGDRAVQALLQHDWPGNVRELENLVERGVILATHGDVVEMEHLFPHVTQTQLAGVNQFGKLSRLPSNAKNELIDRILDSGLPIEEIENDVLALAVERSGGKLAGAARLLGITRPQLAYRLKRMNDSDHTEERP